MAARLIEKKFKRVAASLLALVIALCVCMLVGCGGNDSAESNVPTRLSFERQNITIERFAQEKTKLTENIDGVMYSSSDDGIVKIDADGNITGVGIGTAILTATANGANATTTVSVKRNKSYPVLEIVDSLCIPISAEYALEPKLTYKGVELDVDFGYTVSSDGLTVTNGVIKGSAAGNYTVNVTCDYASEKFSQEVAVTVGNNDYLYISAPEREVALCDVFGQGLATEVTLTARTNASGDVVWNSSDESVLTVVGGTVTPVSEGKAVVRASCGNLTDSVTIAVNKARLKAAVPIDYDKSETYIDVDLTNSTLGAAFVLKKSDLTVYSSESENALPISSVSGKTVRIPSGAVPLGEQNLAFETHDFVVELDAVAASKIINDKQDFMSIESAFRGGSGAQPNPHKYRDGYFILNADIDLQDELFGVDQRGGDSSFFRRESHDLESDCKETAERVQYGWYGVLDGRGHVVKNIKSGKRGLFGTVEKDSEIKNIAFVNAKMSFTSGMGGENSGFIAEMVVGTIDNMLLVLEEIPVSLDGRNVWGKAGVSTYVYGEIKNSAIIVTTTQSIPTEEGYSTPYVVAVTLDGSPVDDLPVGRLTNTLVLSHGNLSVVGYIRNGKADRYSKVDTFASLLQRADRNEFKDFWNFTQNGLTFGSYSITSDMLDFDKQ